MTLALGIMISVLVVILALVGYRKASPDVALIRTGLRPTKSFTGKSFICIPFLEKVDKLVLETIAVDIKTTNPVPTADYIPISVDAVCVVQVELSKNEEGKQLGLELATKNFLNKKKDEIIEKITQTLEGNMREIIASLELKEMVSDRKKFGELVNQNVGEDLSRMGIAVVSFNVQNFSDQNGVIDSMGVDNTERIRKEAAISRAQSAKEVSVKESEAAKESNDARILSETSISERNTELEIRKAELKTQADTQKAKSDAAYEIQKQEQQKAIVVAVANAEIAKQEREIELKSREAEVKEKELLATVEKQADAELYQKQKQYEADTYKAKQLAEARKAQADADLYMKQKESEGIALVGRAEAEAISAKGLAEAEALEKKAEAQLKMGNASVLEMYFKALPEVAKAVSEPLTKIDSITMYGEGNSSKMVGDITKSMTQIMSGIQDATGLDVTSILSGYLGGKLSVDTNVPKAPSIIIEG